ncbi:hypothetical protein STEG23_034499 [Scotinomys teguina]
MAWTNQFNYPQTYILGLESAHPYSCLIYDLLEREKELVLQTIATRSSWGNSGISKRSFDEDPVMMVYQKSEALNQTMTHCNEHFSGGADWTKGCTARHTEVPNATRMNEEVLERWRSKSHGDPAAMVPQDQSLQTLQQIIDGMYLLQALYVYLSGS